MRKRKLTNLLLLSILSILLCSCNEENDNLVLEGRIEFKATVVDSQNKSSFLKSNDLSEVTAAIVTIEDENGVKIYKSKQIDIYKFNDAYITEPLSIITGTYSLTSFYLIDSSGSVIYASPLGSSTMAYVVDQPLPISFNVNKDEITTLEPEVLSTEGYTPDDFGYVNFGLNEVEIFDFLITVFKYNSSIENFELTDAELLITSDNDTLYINSIEPITNKITIKDGYDNYNISLTKSGYKDYNNTYTCDSLKKYYSNPLTVIMEATSLADGLKAYYPFDGNVNDYSGSANNATNYGAELTTDRFGNENSAYYFDGLNDYMQLANTLDASKGLTFSFWINSNGIQDGENNSTVICKYNMAYDYHCFSIGTHNSLVGHGLLGNFYSSQYDTDFRDCAWSNMMTVDDVPSQWDSDKFDLINPMELPLNNWVFCIINVTDTEVQAWINGVLTVKKEREYTTYYNSDNEPTYIGNNLLGGEGSNNHFYGSLDELRVYNRALTEDEIQALYHEDGWNL